MKDVLLSGDLIVEYPQLHKWTILFREGGMQNFMLGFEDLPGRVQAQVRQLQSDGKVVHVQLPSTADVIREGQDGVGENLHVNLYGSMLNVMERSN